MEGAESASTSCWANDWDALPLPIAREDEGYCSILLTCNATDDPVSDLELFLRHMNESGKLADQLIWTIESHTHLNNHKSVRITSQGSSLSRRPSLQGYLTALPGGDANLGNVAHLVSTTLPGFRLLKLMQASVRHGYCAVLDHVATALPLYQMEDNSGRSHKLQLQTVTGLAIEKDWDSLTTRISLQEAVGDESFKDVARCCLTYHDESADRATAPTIVALEEESTKNGNFKGQNYERLPVLWYWVKTFVEENFLLESHHHRAPSGHVWLQAQLMNNCVVGYQSVDCRAGAARKPVLAWDFLYNEAGFRVRSMDGCPAFSSGPPRALLDYPHERLGVRYVNLLSKIELHERTNYVSVSEIEWPAEAGWRACRYCRSVRRGLMVCTACRHVRYCNRKCQRCDWKRHALECKK